MKKILGLVVVLMLAVALSACGKKDAADNRDLGSILVQDVNVRRAISLAIDKQYYTDTLLANGSYPADYYLPYDFYAYDGEDFRDRAETLFGDYLDFNTYTMPDGSQAPSGYNHYNVEEAQKLWADAKMRYGISDDQTITFDFLVHTNAAWDSLYNHVKSEIEKNLPGAKINIVSVTFGEKLKKAPSGDWDILFSGWGPDYMDPTTYLDLFMTENGHNNGGYSNVLYDYIVGEAKNGGYNSPLERFHALVEAEALLIQKDVVVLPIFQSRTVGLRRTQLQDLWGQKVGPDYFMKWAKWDTTDPWVQANRMSNGKTELRLLETSNIPDIVSFTTTDQVSFYMLAALNEGLLTAADPKSDNPYVSGMATSWDVSADGLTYTFHLRADQPWVTSTGDVYTVDGQPQYVKAQDFVFAWQKLADPRVASQYNYLVETAGIKGFDVIYADPEAADLDTQLANLGVKALDNTTLQVTLEYPADYFLGLMSFPSFYPVNEQFYTAKGEDYGKSQEEGNVLYNGAYYFSEWTNDQYHVMKKNAHYWDANTVSIDTVTYIVKEGIQPDVAVQMYLDNEIDSVNLATAALKQQYGSRPDVRRSGSVTAWYLEFNVANHPDLK